MRRWFVGAFSGVSSMTDPNLAARCVQAHDKCNEFTGPCPYCEPTLPLRDANTGRFVALKDIPQSELTDDRP